METAVIIPSLNATTVAKTIDALLRQTIKPDQIIVVGRDEPNQLAGYSDVMFIDTQVPICAAAARNRGIAATSAEIVLLLDSDCIPEPHWLATHVAAQANGHAVIGGGILIDSKNYWTQSDNVSMFHDFVAQLPEGPRKDLPTLNMSVSRAVIDAVGGFDESFPGAAGEDSDWAMRIKRAGFSLHFVPTAAVRHAPARTTWRDFVRHWQGMGRGGIRVRLRYKREFNTPMWVGNPFWLRVLSPLVALRGIGRIFTQSIFWRYWTALPVVFASKIIYCFSAARAIENGEVSA